MKDFLMYLLNFSKFKKLIAISLSLVSVIPTLGASAIPTTRTMDDVSFCHLLELANDEYSCIYPTTIGRKALFSIASTQGHTKRFGAAYFLYALKDRDINLSLNSINFGEGKENWLRGIDEAKREIDDEVSLINSSGIFEDRVNYLWSIAFKIANKKSTQDFFVSLDALMEDYQKFAQYLFYKNHDTLEEIARHDNHPCQFIAAYKVYAEGKQSGLEHLRSMAVDHENAKQWHALAALWKSRHEEEISFVRDVFGALAFNDTHPQQVSAAGFFLRSPHAADQILGLNSLHSILLQHHHPLQWDALESLECFMQRFSMDQDHMDYAEGILKSVALDHDHPLQMGAAYTCYLLPSQGIQELGRTILENIALNFDHPMQVKIASMFLSEQIRRDSNIEGYKEFFGQRPLQSIASNQDHPQQLKASLVLFCRSDEVSKRSGVLGLRSIIADDSRTLSEKIRAAGYLLPNQNNDGQEENKELAYQVIKDIAKPDMTLLSILSQDSGNLTDEWNAREQAAILLEDSEEPEDEQIAKKTLTTLARYRARRAGLDENFIRDHLDD